MTMEGTFYGVKGAELFYRVFKPKGVPKAAVIVVHGHGDHSGGLQNLCACLVEHEYIAYAFDLRGHGKSSGTRGFIRTWEEYRGDLHEFRKLVTSELSELPLYIVAHSLGGVISLDYSLYHGADIAGLVAIAPAVSYEVKPIEKLLIALMGKLKPDYTIEKSSNLHLLTQDPEMITRLSSDVLRHNTVTPGLGRGLIQTLSGLMNQAHSIEMPFLLQYGLDDEITPPTKLRQFFNSVGSQDKQKFEYDSMRHRPFDDLGRKQFFADMLSWLDRQIASEK
ncbi:alpha/beta hydrolase [Aneurinibacillus tyrosinisolvens]|uniref:alpha/beta hydrolase n=1 Tax=Aneurinibacillus tyrosinisolvens TaxID=1443435 RepID=UPI00063F5A5C|nr:alpha/beta hydrolase [Aneurinibacillus tyrosinisolvens]